MMVGRHLELMWSVRRVLGGHKAAGGSTLTLPITECGIDFWSGGTAGTNPASHNSKHMVWRVIVDEPCNAYAYLITTYYLMPCTTYYLILSILWDCEPVQTSAVDCP